jgi:hypothetical protein
MTIRSLAAALLAAGTAFGAPSVANAADPPASAVVLLYYRFGEDRNPTSSIRLDQFEAHIAELAAGRYRVMPLADIVEAFRSGKPLPPRAIAITIDGGYASTYREAWPRLRAAKLPFTVFVAPETADRGGENFVGWDALREMRATGASIGITTTGTLRPNVKPEDLARLRERAKEKLGAAPTLFAYVGGEFSAATKKALGEAGYAAAFGQQQGAAHAGQDALSLPRFALAQNFGDLPRFQRVIASLPLPISDLSPVDTTISTNPPLVGFTVEGVSGLDKLSCSASHESAGLKVEILGDTRVEIRMNRPFPPGRGRITCTMTGPEGRLRWLGLPFYVAGS